MIIQETITVVKTVEVHLPEQLRFLPGDQRFVLWYGLVLGELTPCCVCGERVQSVKTNDGREWMLRHHVALSEVNEVLEATEIVVEVIEDYFRIKNPWCPAGREAAWLRCAINRFTMKNTEGAVHEH